MKYVTGILLSSAIGSFWVLAYLGGSGQLARAERAKPNSVGAFVPPQVPLVLAPHELPSWLITHPPLFEFVEWQFDVCGAKMSEAKRAVRAKQIARVAEKRFATRRHQEAFVTVACIESQFSDALRSPAGAVGIVQIMPQLANEFSQACGLGKVEASDLMDVEINLQIGACRFAELLRLTDGNIALALSGYNSGIRSSTTEGLKRLRAGAAETMGYVAKWAVLYESARNR